LTVRGHFRRTLNQVYPGDWFNDDVHLSHQPDTWQA
jgi:hypothetical protein